jgi:hypothetical protein
MLSVFKQNVVMWNVLVPLVTHFNINLEFYGIKYMVNCCSYSTNLFLLYFDWHDLKVLACLKRPLPQKLNF